MQKQKNKKQLLVLTVLFALVLLTAFVYAAAANTLTFTGTATFNAYTGPILAFTDVSPNATSTGSSTGTAVVSNFDPTGDNVPSQIVTIVATFTDEEDVLTFDYRIQNIGDANAKITNITNGSSNSTALILGGSHVTDAVAMQAVTYTPGMTSPTAPTFYTFTVALDEGTSPGTETYTFEVNLEYGAE